MFSLTEREREALFTVVQGPDAWAGMDGRTLCTLVAKGLVASAAAPLLTSKGRLCCAMLLASDSPRPASRIASEAPGIASDANLTVSLGSPPARNGGTDMRAPAPA